MQNKITQLTPNLHKWKISVWSNDLRASEKSTRIYSITFCELPRMKSIWHRILLQMIMLKLIEHSIQYQHLNIFKIETYFEDVQLLTKDILYKVNHGHCLTLITDELYEIVLQYHLLKELNTSTYFLIKILDNEDMLSPNYVTVQTIKEARNAGCKTYLIYFANGIQTGRILQFIDLYRVLDTRAQYIVLYDYRLFVPQMHYIWKRIINVIFIRQYNNNHNKNISTGTGFELSTVPFPLWIKDVFVTKQLDIWRMGRYRQGTTIFREKTLNLQGQPMRVVVLKHIPAISGIQLINNEVVYSGLEIEIIKLIATIMNFTIKFYETEDSHNERLGKLHLNGTVTGLLGEMVNGRADFALGNLYYTKNVLEKLDLSIPYSAQCLTFLTPQTLTDNSWQTLILPFSPGMWTGVLFLLFSVGFVFYGLTQLNVHLNNTKFATQPNRYMTRNLTVSRKNIPQLKRIKKKQNIIYNDMFECLDNCILYTYSMLLFVPLPRYPKSWSIRLLTGWYWIYCILIVVLYRASLTAILAKPEPILTIDTLKQLAESPINCGAWGEENRIFFLTSLDEIGQTIGEKLEENNDLENAVARVIQGTYAYYENEYFLKDIELNNNNFIQAERVQQKLHVMKECAINMPISIGLEKNSPIKPRLDNLLRRIIESGLINKWLLDTISYLNKATDETESQKAIMNLKKMYGALAALAIGYILALLTFFGEIIHWHYVVIKNPKFDKYNMCKIYQKYSSNSKI